MSKTLAEAVSQLWKELADAIIKLEQQTPSEDDTHSQGRGMALPADQPTIESFWRTPPTDIDNDKTKSPKDPILKTAKTQKKNIQHYKCNSIQNPTSTMQHGGL